MKLQRSPFFPISPSSSSCASAGSPKSPQSFHARKVTPVAEEPSSPPPLSLKWIGSFFSISNRARSPEEYPAARTAPSGRHARLSARLSVVGGGLDQI